MWSIIFMVINFKIVKSTLQNALFLHFFSKKFAYIKKKQYLCTRFKNNINNLILTIMKTNEEMFEILVNELGVNTETVEAITSIYGDKLESYENILFWKTGLRSFDQL